MNFLIVGLVTLLLAGCTEKSLFHGLGIAVPATTQISLDESDVIAALKGALNKGITQAAMTASADDGYFANPRLKLGFPPEVRRVDKALRKLKLGQQVDRFILQLNRSAERAAGQARPIFVDAIQALSIRDAFQILHGPPDAATRYLRLATGDRLHAQFLPIVTNKLAETKATARYGAVVKQYNRLPLVRQVDADLAAYATAKAIDGLFLLIADEEAKIRRDPAARSSQLLQRVFGSLD